VGHLFTDEFLKPGEKIAVTEIFHVPQGKYDKLEAYVTMPSATVGDGVALEWTVDENSVLNSVVYRVSGGQRQPMEKDKKGGYSDERLGLQEVDACSRLSLWD
jgi:hypothetical protein